MGASISVPIIAVRVGLDRTSPPSNPMDLRPCPTTLPALALLLGLACTSTWAQRGDATPRALAPRGALAADELANIEVFKRLSPSVVHITTLATERDFFNRSVQQVPSGTGSGFVWDNAGHIVTNFHVIQEGSGARVTLADQSSWPATLVGAFADRDLAVLKINAPRDKLPAIPVGSSRDLQVGQKVYAIGNPFGLDQTLTIGIVSALNREIDSANQRTIRGVIQTDAAINPGNSGGPLLDSMGNVIGINTAIYGPGGNIGIGFAMPINKAKLMISDHRAGKSYKRPRLGVEVIYVTGEWAEALDLPAEGGLLIQGVQRASPAERAGLKGPRQFAIVGNAEIGIGGDLIMAIDGQPCDRPDSITRAVAKKRAGDTIELTIARQRKISKLKVQLGEAPDDGI